MSAKNKIIPIAAIIILVGAAVIVAFLQGTATDSEMADRMPNIVLITMDTTRVDHLSCYGYERETTPNIDKLAEEGHLFTRAVSTSSWTLPAHASLFTGTYPSRHGARFAPHGAKANAPLHVNKLDGQYPTLAEILGDRGYKTAGIGGGPWFHKEFGLGRGFDFFMNGAVEGGAQWMAMTAEELNEPALNWLERNYKKPFFLFLNYFDPHTPYHAPAPFDTKFGQPKSVTDAFEVAEKVMKHREKLSDEELHSLLLAYDNEIAYADFHLGNLLAKMKELGVYDNSIIVVTSDHGEYFGEHDLLTHSVTVYEEVVRIPLIIKFPRGQDEKMSVEDRVQLTDIIPTILAKLEIPIPETVQGDVIGGASHPIIVESFQHFDYTKMYGERFDNDWRALYKASAKYIWTRDGESQLFNLSKDPGEMNDLAAEHSEQLESLENEMSEWMSSFSPYPFSSYKGFEPDLKKEELESLRTLGYIQ
jgi:arylsulfatase A-like enzyme